MMWGYWQGGWDWLWMAGMMLLFWGGLVAAILLAVRSWRGGAHAGDGALDILRQRLAKGEITPAQYEEIRRTLRS